ncbi:ferritin [Euzebya tangerina]|uniref:ferritin n=1 Tax=Euzebya tangerina TaxID=591198 RepID=UPI000E31AC41|nr:ferritin [Euzebya tangerina]
MDASLIAAFNDQIALEQASARAYQQLAIWAESRDLNGMAQWFQEQSAEENEHADLFIHYVLDRDCEVELQPLEAPQSNFEDAVAAFEAALAHEEKVTAAIGDLYGKVTAAGDYRSIPLLTRFLDEQVHEEAAVRTIVGELRMTGGDPTAVLMLDRELPGRRSDGDEAV